MLPGFFKILYLYCSDTNMKANIAHIIELRKQNLLKYWVTYLKIKKYCNGRGYISRSNTRHCCVTKYSTFINHINKMIKLGWIRKSRNGYFLVSYRIVAGLESIEILGDSENELRARAAALAFDRSIICQIYKEAGNNIVKRKQHLARKKGGRIDVSKYSVGVRWFSNLFGYASPTSGSKIETMWFVIKKLGIVEHCFIKNDYVYKRQINRLTPIN